MSDLIERVARKARWHEESHTWTAPYYGCHEIVGWKIPTITHCLEPLGLVLLLKELLAAGWHFGKEGDRFIAATTASRTAGYVFHFGPTLEEAVCLAFLEHKGER